MILYEYPFNETVRTWLRLERLLGRLEVLIARESAIDHHHALTTLFEILEVGSRSDLKGELLKELDRQRTQLTGYLENPAVQQEVLRRLIDSLQGAFSALNEMSGKVGAALQANEWLSALRSRLAIPGGTCEFDVPAYHAWQHRPAEARRADLQAWVRTIAPMMDGVRLLLGLIRDNGLPQRAAAPGGQYQQTLPTGKTYQLLRVRLPIDSGLIPEITGHRLMVSVRFMKADEEGRLKPYGADCSFELTLCA